MSRNKSGEWRGHIKSHTGTIRGLHFILLSNGLPLTGFKACDMVTGLNFRYGYRGEDGFMKDKTLEKDNGEG